MLTIPPTAIAASTVMPTCSDGVLSAAFSFTPGFGFSPLPATSGARELQLLAGPSLRALPATNRLRLPKRASLL